MIIYSKKIIQFIKEIKRTVKNILAKEIGLKVGTGRFYDRQQKASYPINIVVYNTRSMLGYFDPTFYEMGFHECLMHCSKEQLHSILRHELAHYMAFIMHGNSILPHGAEFRDFCRQMQWGEEVYRATICLEGGQNVSSTEESSIFRKVQKLMALATSSNKHEAEQAMIKSQQLLLKHNIDYLAQEDEEKVFLKRILQQKREDAKMRSIGMILQTFFVNTVYSRSTDYTYLEILGNEVNVEIAEYVALTLNGELDNLWTQARKQSSLKGTIAKNSFFLGLAKGYCDKIHALKREYNTETTKALMVIENKLIDAKEMAYQRLSTVRRGGSHCAESSALGEKIGRQLNINPALNRPSTYLGKLLELWK